MGFFGGLAKVFTKIFTPSSSSSSSSSSNNESHKKKKNSKKKKKNENGQQPQQAQLNLKISNDSNNTIGVGAVQPIVIPARKISSPRKKSDSLASPPRSPLSSSPTSLKIVITPRGSPTNTSPLSSSPNNLKIALSPRISLDNSNNGVNVSPVAPVSTARRSVDQQKGHHHHHQLSGKVINAKRKSAEFENFDTNFSPESRLRSNTLPVIDVRQLGLNNDKNYSLHSDSLDSISRFSPSPVQKLRRNKKKLFSFKKGRRSSIVVSSESNSMYNNKKKKKDSDNNNNSADISNSIEEDISYENFRERFQGSKEDFESNVEGEEDNEEFVDEFEKENDFDISADNENKNNNIDDMLGLDLEEILDSNPENISDFLVSSSHGKLPSKQGFVVSNFKQVAPRPVHITPRKIVSVKKIDVEKNLNDDVFSIEQKNKFRTSRSFSNINMVVSNNINNNNENEHGDENDNLRVIGSNLVRSRSFSVNLNKEREMAVSIDELKKDYYKGSFQKRLNKIVENDIVYDLEENVSGDNEYNFSPSNSLIENNRKKFSKDNFLMKASKNFSDFENQPSFPKKDGFFDELPSIPSLPTTTTKIKTTRKFGGQEVVPNRSPALAPMPMPVPMRINGLGRRNSTPDGETPVFRLQSIPKSPDKMHLVHIYAGRDGRTYFTVAFEKRCTAQQICETLLEDYKKNGHNIIGLALYEINVRSSRAALPSASRFTMELGSSISRVTPKTKIAKLLKNTDVKRRFFVQETKEPPPVKPKPKPTHLAYQMPLECPAPVILTVLQAPKSSQDASGDHDGGDGGGDASMLLFPQSMPIGNVLNQPGTGAGQWIDASELKVVRKIASGRYSKVMKGFYNGNPVAIKILKGPLTSGSIELFRKELAILCSTKHPNLLQFYGACIDGDRVQMITEYCSKGSIHQYLNDPREYIDWQSCLEMLLQIAKALNYLHTFNPPIIHRDLKSLNVLLREDDVVKVADFGMSRFNTNSNNESLGKVAGTMTHCAPEIYSGEIMSVNSDVYSFAIMVWEVVSRVINGSYTSPFAEYNFLHFDFQILVHAAQKSLRPTIPPNTPPAFVKLMTTCWHPVAMRRPSSFHIMQQLEMALEMYENDPDSLKTLDLDLM